MTDFEDIVNTAVDDTIEDRFGVNDKTLAKMVQQAVETAIQQDLCGPVVTIDQAHHEIHEGCYIFADDISGTLGLDTAKYWLLVTPNETNYLHSFPQLTATGEFEVQVYEGVTVATNGTELPLYNRNRAVTTPITFKFYKDPTTPVVTNCPIVRNIRTGAGKGAVGEIRAENELILLPNTKYLIKATSRVAGNYISCHMNGYICGMGE